MFDQLGPEHLRSPRSTNDAVAVFAAQRTAKFENEIGYLVGDVVHPVDAGGFLQIDERTDVEAPHTGVTVVPGFGAMPFDDLVESFDILWQTFG